MSDAAVTRARTSPSARSASLLLAPAALLLLVIVVYPIATLFWNSLHSVDQAQPAGGRAVRRRRQLRARLRRRPLLAVDAAHGALHRRHGAGLAAGRARPRAARQQAVPASSGRCASACCCRGRCRWCSRASSSAGSSSTSTGVVNDWLVALGIEPLQWLSDPDARVLARSASRSSGRRRRSWR